MTCLAALSRVSENFCADVNFVLFSLIQSTEVIVLFFFFNQIHDSVDSLWVSYQ